MGCDSIIREIEPIQDRRREYEATPERVHTILLEGAERARVRAQVTMNEVRRAIGLS